MIFIIEGPDGAGKTTLANAIIKHTRGHYIHLSYRFRNKINTYHEAALRYAFRHRNPNIVIDRWWPSEAVYSEAYRGGSKWPEMGRMLHDKARSYGVIYVICLPNSIREGVENHERNKAKRSEIYSDISKVIELYRKLWYGDKDFKGKSFFARVIRRGGMKKWNRSYKYNIYENGDLKKNYIAMLLEKSHGR